MPRFIMACVGSGVFTVSQFGVKPAVEFELNQRLSAVDIGYTQVKAGCDWGVFGRNEWGYLVGMYLGGCLRVNSIGGSIVHSYPVQ